MRLSYPYAESVIVRTMTVTGQNSLGNDVKTWTDRVVPNVPIWDPRFGNAEKVQGQDQVISDLALWLPLDVAVTPFDRVIARGELYEVDGKPGVFRNPFTGTSGQQVNINRITG